MFRCVGSSHGRHHQACFCEQSLQAERIGYIYEGGPDASIGRRFKASEFAHKRVPFAEAMERSEASGACAARVLEGRRYQQIAESAQERRMPFIGRLVSTEAGDEIQAVKVFVVSQRFEVGATTAKMFAGLG